MDATAIHWTTIASVWASVAVCLAAVGAVVVNYLLLRSQTDPKVVVYSTADRNRPSIILLVIENIGRGVATDVRFEVTGPIPSRAWGMSIEDAALASEMEAGPLFDGIPALGPGAQRVITWGQYGGLRKNLGDRTVRVVCSYRTERLGLVGEKDLRTECFLEVRSFEQTDVSADWRVKVPSELEKIRMVLERQQRQPRLHEALKGLGASSKQSDQD